MNSNCEYEFHRTDDIHIFIEYTITSNLNMHCALSVISFFATMAIETIAFIVYLFIIHSLHIVAKAFCNRQPMLSWPDLLTKFHSCSRHMRLCCGTICYVWRDNNNRDEKRQQRGSIAILYPFPFSPASSLVIHFR